MSRLTLFRGNHMVLEWLNMTNSITDESVTGATVEVTIVDPDGVEVTGEAWPVTLSEVAAGHYRATVSNELEVDDDIDYTAILDATGPGGEKGHKEVPVDIRTWNV